MSRLNFVKQGISTQQVGEAFVSHYRTLGYQEIPGGSLLSEALPMTFVMSAGMVQFEKLSQQPRHENHYVLIQNCFRHFDLDKVGNSDFHLSLFQMPGAFYFGAPDRRQTVSMVWELLTRQYGFDPAKLFVTYFSGGRVESQILPADLDTAAAWQAIGVPEEHILGLPAGSNFWRQSTRMVGIVNSRKCGPNTEVFYDRGAHLSCGPACRPGCPCGRFVEILNNLYITLHLEEKNGGISPLEEPFIETVIGCERVAAMLQGANTIYDIDNLFPLVEQVRCFSKSALLPAVEQRRHEHLLADHLRALLFLARDGAPAPGKGGRPHIMRILARELLTSMRLLGISDPGFLRSMLRLAVEYYPELASATGLFMEYLAGEEPRFMHTVQSGLQRFEAEIQQKGAQQIDGRDILRFETSHGIPFSWLEFELWKKHLPVDRDGYQTARQAFRQTSRG